MKKFSIQFHSTTVTGTNNRIKKIDRVFLIILSFLLFQDQAEHRQNNALDTRNLDKINADFDPHKQFYMES